MTLQRWTGNSPSVAQVSTLTPVGPIPGDLFSVVCNGKAVTYTTAAGTVADVCSGLQAALASSANPEFLEIGWVNSSTYVKATSNLKGRPFTITASVTPSVLAVPTMGAPTGVSGGTLTNSTTYYYVMTATNAAGQTTQSAQVSFTATSPNLTAVLTWAAITGATGYKIYRSTTSGTYGASTLLTTIGSGATVTYNDTGSATTTGTPPGSNGATSPVTFTLANTVTSAGPNDWSVAANWSTNAVPVTGDNVLITGTSTPILYGLGQSAVTLASLQIDASFTGTIGNPDFNPSGYYEYRSTYLAIWATTTTIGLNGGSGSGRLRLNFGTVQTAVSVYATASPADPGLTALQIRGTNASNTLFAYAGNIGLAVQSGETATFATVTSSFLSNQNSDVSLYGGTGLTLTNLNQNGGKVTLNGGFTTGKITGGNLYVLGTGASTTITLDAANLAWYSSGTITTLNVGPGAVADFSKDARSKTVTTCTLYAGATLRDTNAAVTYTNGIAMAQTRLADVTIDLGENRTIGLLV